MHGGQNHALRKDMIIYKMMGHEANIFGLRHGASLEGNYVL